MSVNQPTPRFGAPRRIAAVGLVTLSMMMPLASAPAHEVRQLIRDAQFTTDTLGTAVGEANTMLVTLPGNLRREIGDALDSARAATAEASTALARATDNVDGSAAGALADAQIALDAAFAQVRYVADLAEQAAEPIAEPLNRIQGHLRALRGETGRATV